MIKLNYAKTKMLFPREYSSLTINKHSKRRDVSDYSFSNEIKSELGFFCLFFGISRMASMFIKTSFPYTSYQTQLQVLDIKQTVK